MVKIDRSEITPEHLYLSRRKFIKGLVATAGALTLATCTPGPSRPVEPSGKAPTPEPTETTAPTQEKDASTQETPKAVFPTVSADVDELGDKLTSQAAINAYNNYYEFSLDKEGVAPLAQEFQTSPWTIKVGGLVNKPRAFDISSLLDFPQEERIYRLRCVEAWSMVIPWVGFPISKLLAEVEPMSQAKYVRFETLYDPQQMPGQSSKFYDWPYVEGLRMDEAMNDLAILATGIYGKPLLPQNGAPLRLVVPWKYGFKSIKSIVKIDLVDEMPVSLWMTASPREYGFYANVNPEVPHPRWSQATERRIGETSRIKTMLFNGYAEEVAHLYPDLENREWFY